MQRKANHRQIRAALAALESLRLAEGRSRNQRLVILRKAARNQVLKQLFLHACDPRSHPCYAIQDWQPNQRAVRKPDLIKNWNRFTRILRSSKAGVCKPSEFYGQLDELLSGLSEQEQFYHRALQKHLHVGVSSRLASTVWPELRLRTLPKQEPWPGEGMRVYFILERGHCVGAFSERDRPFNLFAEQFGGALSRLKYQGIFSGIVRSKINWPLAIKLLTSKCKSVGLVEYRELARSFRLELESIYSNARDHRRVTTLIRQKYVGLPSRQRTQVKMTSNFCTKNF